jgi:NAD(P)H-dependent FMN reductase
MRRAKRAASWTTQGKKVAVVVCSQRKPRVNPAVAEFVCSIVDEHINDTLRRRDPAKPSLRILDVAGFDLPLTTEEPRIPMQMAADAKYTEEATQRWSAAVRSFDGFIFVTPQYNWGYPASLKNALDKLFHEWTGKPAMVVSYGSRGGEKAAAQLKQVLQGLRMQVVDTTPAFALKGPELDDGDSMAAAVDSGTLLPRLLEQWRAGAEGASVTQGWVEVAHLL